MYFADGLAVNNIRWVRKIVGLMLAMVMAAAGLAFANTEDAGAQPVRANQSAAARCSAYHLFGAEPVDVAKTADGETVLAQVSWRWHDSIGCYLILDDDAAATLRAAGQAARLFQGQTEASRRCSAHHRFGAEPVDVAKSTDGQTVLAQVSWRVNSTIGCYLVLDGPAVEALRAAETPPAPIATAPGVPTGVTALAGHRQITVAWTPPADDGGASITGYTVAYNANAFVCPTTLDSTWTQRSTARNTVTLSNLANGTSYLLCVKANNRAGGSGWASASATPASVPGTPSNVNLTGGDGQITATWTAAPDNGASITSYTIQRCNAAGGACTSTWIDAGTATTTRHIISGLSDGTSYGIRIRATNANGPGSWSTTAYESTGAFPPDTPSEVTAAVGNRYITLEWDAPDPNGSPITGYTVECRLSANTVTTGNCNSSSWVTYRTISSTSVTIGSLTNGVSYDLRVRATNRVGSSDWSEVVTATASATPRTPSGLEARASGRTIQVSWNAPTSGGSAITEYIVEYCGGNCTTWRSTTVSGTPPRTSTSLTGLSNGTAYSVRVRAVNAAGESPWSLSASATTPAVPGAPTITGFTVSDTLNGTVQWTAPSNDGGGAITGYDVGLCVGSATNCTDTGGSWRTATTVSTSPATLINLSGATSYNVRVRAVNAAGSGGWSGILREITAAATVPNAPSGVTATGGNSRITVQWTAPSAKGASITSYTLAYKAGATSSTTCPASLDGTWTTQTAYSTSYTIYSLTNGTAYAVCVRANNSQGSGAWNTDTSATAVSATPATAPSAPANFTATPSDKRINLEWSAPATGGSAITGYTVEFKRGSDNWSFVTYVASTTTSISLDDGTDTSNTSVYDVGITNGATYGVRVRTHTGTGTSQWSSKTVSLPKTPTGSLSAAQNGEAGQLSLTWVVYNNASASLQVAHRAASSGNCPTSSSTLPSGWAVATITEGTTSTVGSLSTYPITVTGLAHGTKYRLCVRDQGATPSVWSTTVSATTPTVPNAPSGLTAKAGNTEIILSWNPYSNTTNGGTALLTGGSGYTVQCKLITGTASTACQSQTFTDVDDSAAGTTITIDELSNNATYQVRIRATNGAGDSSWSTTSNLNPSTVPGQPASVAATHGNKSVKLTWNAPAANGRSISGYTVAYKAAASSCPITLDSTWATTTTSYTYATISSLTNGTNYGFCVRAKNSNGSGEWHNSSATTSKPSTMPSAPTIESAASSNTTIALRWTAPANNGDAISSYAVARKAGSGSCPTSIPTSNQTVDDWAFDVSATSPHSFSGLTNGTSYRLCVWAKNRDGYSSSSSTSATPSTVPNAPAGVAATVESSTQIKLTWTLYVTSGNSRTDGGSSITGYNVVYKSYTGNTAPNCPASTQLAGWTLKSNLSSSITSYTVSGLTPSTKYALCIWATNTNGPSALSRATAETSASS